MFINVYIHAESEPHGEYGIRKKTFSIFPIEYPVEN